MGGVVKTVTGMITGDSPQAQAATQAANTTGQYNQQASNTIANYGQQAQNTLQTAGTAAQQLQQPWLSTGQAALGQYGDLVGANGTQNQQTAFDNFVQSPGQQWNQQQQQKALLASSAAIGGLGGGNVRTALQQQASNIAQQNYQQQLNNLGGLSAAGQASAGATGQMGMQTAANIANTLQTSGAGQASALMGTGAAQAQGINSGAAYNQAQTDDIFKGAGFAVGMLSDRDAKEDIKTASPEDCYNAVRQIAMRTWKYKPEYALGTETHLGPMYQEAPAMIKNSGSRTLSLHNEIMMLVGALQFILEREANV